MTNFISFKHDVKKKLKIFGAGGHGGVAFEIAQLLGFQNITFYDDNPGKIGKKFFGLQVENQDSFFEADDCYQFIAIGDNQTRSKLFYRANPSQLINLIHPKATVSKSAKLGRGVMIAANALVNINVTIGDAVIVNSASVIEHESTILAASHIAPGAVLGAGVTVGLRSLIGLGSSIKPFVTIGHDCTIGVGSVVIDDVSDGKTVVGNPAQILGFK